MPLERTRPVCTPPGVGASLAKGTSGFACSAAITNHKCSELPVFDYVNIHGNNLWQYKDGSLLEMVDMLRKMPTFQQRCAHGPHTHGGSALERVPPPP